MWGETGKEGFAGPRAEWHGEPTIPNTAKKTKKRAKEKEDKHRKVNEFGEASSLRCRHEVDKTGGRGKKIGPKAAIGNR